MSENTNEPDLPEIPESDVELEALLRKLNPAPMECSTRDQLHREYRITAMNAAHSPARMHWRRVIPLAAACCLATFAYVSLRYGTDLWQPTTESAPVAALREVAPVEEVSPSLSAPSAGDFVPVSAQGYIVNSASKGVIETDDGPRERMAVEYQDAYHWHDPKTGTNIRIFKPRSEEVIVPLQTD